MLVFFIITVAAAEVAVGLALIVALYRKRQTAHVEDLTSMKLMKMQNIECRNQPNGIFGI